MRAPITAGGSSYSRRSFSSALAAVESTAIAAAYSSSAVARLTFAIWRSGPRLRSGSARKLGRRSAAGAATAPTAGSSAVGRVRWNTSTATASTSTMASACAETVRTGTVAGVVTGGRSAARERESN